MSCGALSCSLQAYKFKPGLSLNLAVLRVGNTVQLNPNAKLKDIYDTLFALVVFPATLGSYYW